MNYQNFIRHDSATSAYINQWVQDASATLTASPHIPNNLAYLFRKFQHLYLALPKHTSNLIGAMATYKRYGFQQCTIRHIVEQGEEAFLADKRFDHPESTREKKAAFFSCLCKINELSEKELPSYPSDLTHENVNSVLCLIDSYYQTRGIDTSFIDIAAREFGQQFVPSSNISSTRKTETSFLGQTSCEKKPPEQRNVNPFNQNTSREPNASEAFPSELIEHEIFIDLFCNEPPLCSRSRGSLDQYRDS